VINAMEQVKGLTALNAEVQVHLNAPSAMVLVPAKMENAQVAAARVMPSAPAAAVPERRNDRFKVTRF